MKSIGHLGLPTTANERFSSYSSFSQYVVPHYLRQVNSTTGRQIVSELGADSRVIKCEGRLIQKGNSASMFDLNMLAAWYLWVANEQSPAIAKQYLDEFLDSDQVEQYCSVWIGGITVSEPISLTNEISILPISAMPDSDDKREFSQPQHFHFHMPPFPQAAVVQRVFIPRDRDPAIPYAYDFQSAQRRYDIVTLLNALPGVVAVPTYSGSYSPEKKLPGEFLGSIAKSWALWDVGLSQREMAEFRYSDLFPGVLAGFDRRSEHDKDLLRLILNRFSQLKRRIQVEDKLLDLGIALEMLLLKGDKEGTQLSLTFRLRGSWLLGGNLENRQQVFRMLEKIYNARSQVAHSGKFKEKSREEFYSSVPHYIELGERLIRKVICDGWPDWDGILLGSLLENVSLPPQ